MGRWSTKQGVEAIQSVEKKLNWDVVRLKALILKNL